MEIHSAARKHAIDDDSIEHAFNRAAVVADLEDAEAPWRQLVIGADEQATCFELIGLQLGVGHELVIHAMPLRRRYGRLLPRPAGPMP